MIQNREKWGSKLRGSRFAYYDIMITRGSSRLDLTLYGELKDQLELNFYKFSGRDSVM
jgi:hypothetical protein